MRDKKSECKHNWDFIQHKLFSHSAVVKEGLIAQDAENIGNFYCYEYYCTKCLKIILKLDKRRH
jgi:hypothetical protein|tara:strand:+ start:3807 stop:3998 length:192 start_codon:yes stop_codon:yes gene_type:complete